MTTKCSHCGKEFDFSLQPETCMGSVACPGCGAIIGQGGYATQLQRSRLFIPFFALPNLTVEKLRGHPVVPGVSICTAGPALGHSVWNDDAQQLCDEWIDDETLRTVLATAAKFVSGIRVNNGHYSEVSDGAGFLNALAIDGSKLRGAFNLFKTYPAFEHLIEMIVTVPDTFGFSLDFDRTHEFRDGKAYARAVDIISCDLVPAPAANRGLFDTRRKQMPEPTPTPAPAPAPAPASPSTEAITEAIKNALKSELPTALSAEIKPLRDDITALTQRVNEIEASMKADEASDKAMPAMKALKELRTQINETNTKLAKRLGMEFAARAGANPVEHPAGDKTGGGDTRKPFEIPASEQNTAAARALLGK